MSKISKEELKDLQEDYIAYNYYPVHGSQMVFNV